MPETCPTREEFVCALLEFLNTELPGMHPEVAGIRRFDRTTPLFEVGGIDSLSIIHIVAFLEAVLGSTLPLQDITMKNFRSVEHIADLFQSRKNHDA